MQGENSNGSGARVLCLVAALATCSALVVAGCADSRSASASVKGALGESAAEASSTNTQGAAEEQPAAEKAVKLAKAKIKSIEGVKSRIVLTYSKVKGAQTYAVYRKQAKAGATYKRIAQTEKTKFTDTDVTYLKAYKYKVQALAEGGKGAKSDARKVTVTNIDPKKKMIALTFDDGPSQYTDAIVKCLKKNGARATFFVVGTNAKFYQAAMRKAYAAGCEIGNHTYTHPQLTKLGTPAVKSQVSRTDKYIKKATGHVASLLRPPYGSTNKRVGKAVGKPQIIWSVDTLDWKTRSTSKTVAHVKKRAKDGDIVLMHDIHRPTKGAALELIPWLVKKGYQLVTVSELAQYRGVALKAGKTYGSFKK